jgi:CRP/FNR family cyclic AMP-dependent transcriptional regulator
LNIALSTFDPIEFLTKVGIGRTVVKYRKNQKIYAQGDVADSVFYIQKGKVTITASPSTARKP